MGKVFGERRAADEGDPRRIDALLREELADPISVIAFVGVEAELGAGRLTILAHTFRVPSLILQKLLKEPGWRWRAGSKGGERIDCGSGGETGMALAVPGRGMEVSQ